MCGLLYKTELRDVMRKFNQSFKGWLFLLSLVLIGLLAGLVAVLLHGRQLTAEELLSYTPQQPLFAVLFFMLLYAVKSISFFIPVIILQLAVGILFPTPWALLINALGSAVCFSIPYWMGLHAQDAWLQKLLQKYPKVGQMVARQQNRELFVPFLMRVLSFLPLDIVSVYLGSIKIPYKKYLLGSMLGTLPGLIIATLLGTSITDPSSPLFVVSICLMLLLAGGSLLIYWLYNRKKQH